MSSKVCWLLYADGDYAVNRDFAAMITEKGAALGLTVETVLLSELRLGMDGRGEAFCLRRSAVAPFAYAHTRPDAVLSRQRDALVSRHFELMGVPVFNNSRVCELCNDKRLTHQLLRGLPMARTLFVPPWQREPLPDARFPLILKPACGHGGDRVTLVRDRDEWLAAAARIRPDAMLEQRVVSGAGRDLRVYVLFGELVAGVMRTANGGVVSNFKLGGQVALHELTRAERALAQQVLSRFEAAGAPLCFAGVDLLYEGDAPVVGEVEDVVGSRMLYQTSVLDIAAMYLARVRENLEL